MQSNDKSAIFAWVEAADEVLQRPKSDLAGSPNKKSSTKKWRGKPYDSNPLELDCLDGEVLSQHWHEIESWMQKTWFDKSRSFQLTFYTHTGENLSIRLLPGQTSVRLPQRQRVSGLLEYRNYAPRATRLTVTLRQYLTEHPG